jgi:hypothetical protein
MTSQRAKPCRDFQETNKRQCLSIAGQFVRLAGGLAV